MISCMLLGNFCGALGQSRHDLLQSPLLQGMFVTFSKKYKAPKAAIEQTLLDAFRQAANAENLQIDDVACNRDYNNVCPEGWHHLKDSVCQASSIYTGTCAKVIDYADLTPQGKQMKCRDAVFPCVNSCVQNYTQPCPAGWHHDGSSHCLAPTGYEGPCSGRKQTIHLGYTEKKEWGQTCGVQWPCQQNFGVQMQIQNVNKAAEMETSCVTSYIEDCPARWTKSGKYCQAPLDDQPFRCGYFVASRTFTAQQKKKWSWACGSPWPCK